MAQVSQGLETFGSDGDPAVESNAYTLKSSDPTYTTPLATAGEDKMASPAVYCHRRAPVPAFKAYRLSSSDPMYTTPLATAGEDSKSMKLPGYVHSIAPVPAFKAYRLLSSRTRRRPRRWPLPAKRPAWTRRVLPQECSRAGVQGRTGTPDPTYTTPLATAGEEQTPLSVA